MHAHTDYIAHEHNLLLCNLFYSSHKILLLIVSHYITNNINERIAFLLNFLSCFIKFSFIKFSLQALLSIGENFFYISSFFNSFIIIHKNVKII